MSEVLMLLRPRSQMRNKIDKARLFEAAASMPAYRPRKVGIFVTGESKHGPG